MAASKNNMTFVVLAVFLGGCDGCIKPLPAKMELEAASSAKDPASIYAIDLSSIFAKTENFAYKSELTVSTKSAVTSEADQEIIEITGVQPRILFRKKTDSQHFIELIKEKDNYFVRNNGKEFRKGADNKPMYEALLNDGINLLSFMLEQFGLYDRIAQDDSRQGKRVFVIKQGPVSPNAPFVVDLALKFPEFSSMQMSELSGRFEIDEKTALPVYGHFDIVLVGKEQRRISMKADFTLDMNTANETITMPTVLEDEPQAFPVDIGRRFNDLFDGKQGNR